MKAQLLTLALLTSVAGNTLAKSDVDVYIIKATDVQIAEETITIKGSAVTRLTTLSDNDDPEYGGFKIWGRAADSTHVKSENATFVIQKPGPAAHIEAWNDSIAAAKDLKAGKPVGRIGYYSPEVTIKGGLITGISGRGYLYTRPSSHKPIGVTPRPKDAPAWGGTWWTKFANGVNQRNTMRQADCRGGNDHGWSSEGKIDHDNGRIIVTYDDDRIERWTRVRHRMVVEHWHPASAYPDATPIVGIAERTSWEASK